MDNVLNQDLKNYIENITSPEPPLLKNLRQETAAVIGAPQMLCGPTEGRLLQILIKVLQAKNCLEIGTFTGYSALNIAEALPADGKLITCEIRQQNAEFAQKYFDRSPFGHKIEIRLGDAIQTIQQIDHPFDFIFIDADKPNYPAYYDLLIPKLRRGGLMVVDNALWDGEVVAPKDKAGEAIHALNLKARHDESVETVMLSVRDGILLIRKL